MIRVRVPVQGNSVGETFPPQVGDVSLRSGMDNASSDPTCNPPCVIFSLIGLPDLSEDGG